MPLGVVRAWDLSRSKIGLGNVGLTGERRFYRRHQMALHAELLHVAQRSRLHAGLDELFFSVYRQENNLCCGTGCLELEHRVNSTQYWHADVSHDDVREEAESCQHQCRAVDLRSYNVKIGR